MEKLKSYLAWLFCRLGFSPNTLTFLGLLLAGASGYFIFRGRFFLAGSLLLLSGFFDLMDGAVARLLNRVTVFGGILDSSLDRYGDGFIFGGLIFYFFSRSNPLYAALSFSALLGSFSISYVRARAECAIETCRVGFWERGERIVYVALGLLLNNAGLVLWVLGIFTHFTVLARLLRSRGPSQGFGLQNILFHPGGRRSALYFLKVAALGLLVLSWRI